MDPYLKTAFAYSLVIIFRKVKSVWWSFTYDVFLNPCLIALYVAKCVKRQTGMGSLTCLCMARGEGPGVGGAMRGKVRVGVDWGWWGEASGTCSRERLSQGWDWTDITETSGWDNSKSSSHKVESHLCLVRNMQLCRKDMHNQHYTDTWRKFYKTVVNNNLLWWHIRIKEMSNFRKIQSRLEDAETSDVRSK